MKHLLGWSKLNQATRARGINVINSFIMSFIQHYETQVAISELLLSSSLFRNVKC